MRNHNCPTCGEEMTRFYHTEKACLDWACDHCAEVTCETCDADSNSHADHVCRECGEEISDTTCEQLDGLCWDCVQAIHN